MYNLAVLTLIYCFIFCQAAAADTEATENSGYIPGADVGPRIGLVLSGGGARGLAHIGVIKALEEQGVRIHAVAGTSFGAIIGGMYAAGYSADEIEAVARELDWSYALSDSPDRAKYPFRRKQEDFDFLIKGQLTLKDGQLRLPTGLLQGQQLQLVLNKIFAHVATTRDFDRLPIAFRAVATSIVSGQPVVMKDGNLATAVLASMAIPGLITPVKRDGELLVDGGLSNNMPVSAVQTMGVDRIIAVDIGTPLYTEEELSNVFAVLDQLTNFLTRGSTREQVGLLQDTDLLIRADLEGISSADFSKLGLAKAAGYDAVMAHRSTLAMLSAQQGEQVAFALTQSRNPVIDYIRVDNDSVLADRVIQQYVSQRRGQPLDTVQLDEDITRIYALGYFQSVTYEVEQRDLGRQLQSGLRIIAKDRYLGTDHVRLGLNLADDFDGDNSYFLSGSYRRNAVNRLGGEWYSRIQLGENIEALTEFFQPLGYQHRWFVEPAWAYRAENVEFIENGQALGEYRIREQSLNLGFGRLIGNLAEVRLGLERRVGRASPRVGPSDLPVVEYDDGNYFASLGYDSLDSLYFPARGQLWRAKYSVSDQNLGADQDFKRLYVSGLAAFSYGRDRLALGAELLRSYGLQPEPQYQQGLGGFLRLSGLAPNSVVGQDLFLSRAVYFHRVGQPSALPLDIPFYLGGSLEYGNAWSDGEGVRFNDLLLSGSVFAGVDTPIGPLYLSYGLSEAGQQSVNLFLGQIF